MKAIRMRSYGGPELLALDEVPRPQPGRGQVLVQVRAAGVNPVDWKIREGHFRGMSDQTLPAIMGSDIAGVIEDVGPGVEGLRSGQEVFGIADNGADAEYALAAPARLAPKPASLDYVQAASVPIAAMTAWQALFDHGGVTPGQTALIHGAAGGVGMFAVQFARWKNLRVIATASAEDVDFVRELGADEVIDYHTTAFEEIVKNVDFVLDLIGGEVQQRSLKILRSGGVLVSTVEEPELELAMRYNVSAIMMREQPSTRNLMQIGALLDSGQIKTHVERVLPLAEARQAQELSQHGHLRGKIVLQVS